MIFFLSQLENDVATDNMSRVEPLKRLNACVGSVFVISLFARGGDTFLHSNFKVLKMSSNITYVQF